MSDETKEEPATGPCWDCGEPGSRLQEDPYASEICGDSTEHFICTSCANASVRDI